VEKYCRTEQATDDNMAHAHCMLVLCKNGYTNAPNYYVIRTLSVMFQQFRLRAQCKSAEFLFHRVQFWYIFYSNVLDVVFIEMKAKTKFTLLQFRLSKTIVYFKVLLLICNTKSSEGRKDKLLLILYYWVYRGTEN
jgi:hypothetical protein